MFFACAYTFGKEEIKLSGNRKSIKFLFVTITFCLCFSVTACGAKRQNKTDIVFFEDEILPVNEGHNTETARITAIFREQCEQAACVGERDSLEVAQNIICSLGENGYAAVDAENQLDMTNTAQVLHFCDAVDTKRTADLTIIQIVNNQESSAISISAESGVAKTALSSDTVSQESRTEAGISRIRNVQAGVNQLKYTPIQGFQRYDFHTEDGTVDVRRSFYQYRTDKTFEIKDTVRYRADYWQYTQEGYLMLAGSYYSEDYYIVSLTDAPEHAAFRIAPLDAQCRALNRRYIQPVGYACNNLFLVNWDEADFGDLDIYDAFDQFYPMRYHQSVPYVIDDNPGVGAVYHIAKKEFEKVLQTYLNIDLPTLRSRVEYSAEDQAYAYRPRGLYELECSNQPYPEVVGCLENADGTLTLAVNAVFPYENTSKTFSHEVTVRPLTDGAFQYVSNKIVEGNCDAWWRTERLTKEEWEEIYGEQGVRLTSESAPAQRQGDDIRQSGAEPDESLWYLPHADSSLLTEAERSDLETTILTAAGQVSTVYQNLEIEQGASYASNVRHFSKEQCREVVRLLGEAGYISVADDLNMENYAGVAAFYESYTQARDATVTVFQVHSDGLLGVVTFLHRNGRLQTYYAGVGWQEGGMPYIKNTLASDVSTINMTPRGYFIYTYQEEIVHSNATQYLRVKPLSDICRELTRKYVNGISFVNYSAFGTDWDSKNVEEILEPCLFEDIYHMYTGEHIRAENGQIPAKEYERIMMTYFPVTREQLRRKCGYDAASGSYPYEMIYADPYAPFGEVVDYTEHADGTITLTVDGVWIDYNTDCAFTSRIKVQPFADGTFRYLSNTIQQKEKGLP